MDAPSRQEDVMRIGRKNNGGGGVTGRGKQAQFWRGTQIVPAIILGM
jgi:hypothetical protein